MDATDGDIRSKTCAAVSGAGVGVAVGVAVGSGVCVGVGVAVGSGVCVGVGVAVGSGVCVGVGVAVGSGVGVGVAVGSGVGVGVAVGTGVWVAVGLGAGLGATAVARGAGSGWPSPQATPTLASMTSRPRAKYRVIALLVAQSASPTTPLRRGLSPTGRPP